MHPVAPDWWHEQGPTESADEKGAERRRRAHDPLIVELVKLLARFAAERDYADSAPQGPEAKGKPEARQD